ncbi:hypothetical protein JNB_10559 [Janibacter sp. HTCC2649]|uniref:acyl-CoA dehydrogenase family protein n=1 Tax=Janibacter sp. HTCC2649 TaxID=313589 RepID=UPI0000670CFF|nr:acyl-CoA dehydrogenase family protein [Janibacter sp. HTCC2649]EAQ00609.1 hypothetical protein JNB_10559 [Janibacter sp. HTCC2649]
MTTQQTEFTLDPDVRVALASSLRELFAGASDGPGITSALAELGWAEVEAEDPATAVSLLFRAHGASLASSNLLSDTMIRSFGPDFPYAGTPVTLLLPHPTEDAARPASCRRSGAAGILLEAPVADSLVLVPTCQGDRVTLHPVAADWVLARTKASTGFDASSTWLVLETADVLPDANAPVAVDWIAATALARRALSAEILGVCDAALHIACEHVTSRHQYGRAIGSFQAVRHRLAEGHVAVESASSLLLAAWRGVSGGGVPDTPPEWAAAVAKARAGRAQAEVMRTGVQVLGAMGLTLESPMHRHVTRAAALDLLLGGQASLEQSLGDALLSGTTAYPLASI